MELLPFLLVAVVAGLIYAALVLSDRRGSFWLGFVATLVPLEYVDRYFLDLPSALKWLPELALLGSGVAAYVLCPASRARLGRAPWVAALIVLAVAVASFLANRSSPAALVLSQRGLVLFFAALLAQGAATGLYDTARGHSFLVGAGVVSGGVSVLQRLTVAAREPDRVTGLFSLGEVVLYSHLVVLALVLAYWVEGRRVGRWRTGFVVPWMVLSLAVGNQEAAFPYLALLVAFFLVRARRRRLALFLTAAGLGGAMLLVFAALYDTQYRADGKGGFTTSLFSRAYLERYVFGERHDVYTPSGDLLRGAAIVTAYREIAGSRSTMALGRGPGATTESAVAGAGGLLAAQFPGIGRVTLSLLLGEVGLLGLLAHLLFLKSLWRPGHGRASPESAEERLFREATVVLTLGFLVYVRLLFEPIFAWVLALLVPGARQTAPDLPPESTRMSAEPDPDWLSVRR